VAKGSTILSKDRLKTPKTADGGCEVWIDEQPRGIVRRHPIGYVWTARPELPQRTRAAVIDMIVMHFVDTGAITLQGVMPRSMDERTISESVKNGVDLRDKGLCQYCLMSGIKQQAVAYDHFIPFALGGASDISNVQLACAACNRTKWHNHPKEVFGRNWKAYAPGKPRPDVSSL
jgi:hypothetical protein